MEGKKIRTMRNNYGVKAVVLAKQVGVHYSRLSLIENEHVTPRQEELDRITDALAELVKGEG
jgi:predicted transcriptional regulator